MKNQIDHVMRLYPHWRMRWCADDKRAEAYNYSAMMYGTLNISDTENLTSPEGVWRRNVPLTVWIHKSYNDTCPAVRIEVPPGEILRQRSYLKKGGKSREVGTITSSRAREKICARKSRS